MTLTAGLETHDLLEMYHRMVLIRKFEYTVKGLFAKGTIIGALHLYAGEEAVAVGTISNLGPNDYVTSTHRGHGHLIARGVDVRKMMAELFGKETGLCKGKGGSMHMADASLRISAQPVVGGGLPLAVGAGLAAKLDKKNDVAVSFFGDGAANQGTAHESLNLAAIWKLPVIFVCENNQYAESTPSSNTVAGGSIARRAAAYGIPGQVVDGMNVLKVHDEVGQAVRRARNGEGPSLLECVTYRYEGHEEGDPWNTYRTKEEVEQWKKRDPIVQLSDFLITSRLADSADLQRVEAQVDREITEAISYAENSRITPVGEAFTDVFASN